MVTKFLPDRALSIFRNIKGITTIFKSYLIRIMYYTVLDAGVDAVMAQGVEAGGHSVRPEQGRATLPLAAGMVSALKGSGTQVSNRHIRQRILLGKVDCA